MKRLFSIIVVLTICQYSFCQNDNRLYSYSINEMSYYKYNDINVYGTLMSISEVKNEQPEQLVQSILSCSSEEWDILNTLGGKENIDEKLPEDYEKIKKVDKKENYLKLINKVEFKIDSISTAIIKFNLISISFPKPQAGIIVMQKINNKWYKTSTKMISNIALSILRLKPEIIDKFFNNQLDSPELQKIKFKVYTNNMLDFNKLSSEIDSWYINNPKLKEYFKDPYSIL